MNRSKVTMILVTVAVSALLLTGCGSSGGKGCEPLDLDGSPFGATGTATLTGAGTLPDGIPEGLELQLLVKQGRGSIGVLPDNLLANDRICGKNFHYTVKKLNAGTYTLTFDVFDPNSNTVMALFEGTAPGDFTVADGQTLAQDTVFLLSSM
jgi:major membrane immunogen (membrane-anchored lipoprotein)